MSLQILEKFPTHLGKQIMKSSKSFIALNVEKSGELPLTASKSGGYGYFPKSKAFPTNSDGQPLYLLAQLNFSELPPLPSYPTSGILAFYVDLYDDLIGMDLENYKNRSGYAVHYFENPSENSYSKEEQADFYTEEPEYVVVEGEYKLTGEIRETLLLQDCFEFEQYYGKNIYELIEEHFNDATDDILDEIYDFVSANDGDGKIGGFPSFTQEDPRIHNKDLQQDILLFQLDSSYGEGIEIMWGDCGIGNFFIHPDDLRRMNFEHVWYNWDCS
ncbi:YwqG family protein [Lysinibacillus sp. NPDC097287]|uniref:YwqG family protein n=1 Tax=Lysinibacillus sp. NPDC097287 TaxID=3364144 RepID=UPI003815C340